MYLLKVRNFQNNFFFDFRYSKNTNEIFAVNKTKISGFFDTIQADKVSWVDHSIHVILSHPIQMILSVPIWSYLKVLDLNIKIKFPRIYRKFWTKVWKVTKWIVGPLRRAPRWKTQKERLLIYRCNKLFINYLTRPGQSLVQSQLVSSGLEARIGI